MRLWSLHPVYLDSKGLVALWREGLLAQGVLQGNTRGYRNHPQLLRFRNTDDPLGAIACYLAAVSDEADKRGFNFNKSKIGTRRIKYTLSVTRGQVEYEYKHLAEKLLKRDRKFYKLLTAARKIKVHPLFKEVDGDVEDWERT